MRGRHIRSLGTVSSRDSLGSRELRQRTVVVLGVLTLVAACSDGGDTQPSKQGPGQQSSASATTQLGARAALTGFECRRDDNGTWSAKGRLNNPDGSKAFYVVRISVSGKNSHVVASATKNVAVDAKGEVALEVADFGTASGKGLECSAHVTRAVS